MRKSRKLILKKKSTAKKSIKVGEAETDFEIGIQKKRPKTSSYTAGSYCP